ncbi:hypothetical protein [Streptomyces sp. NPDC096311]
MPYATPAPLIEADPHPGDTFQGPREVLLAMAGRCAGPRGRRPAR